MQYIKAVLITSDGEAVVCENFAGVFHTKFNDALFVNTIPTNNVEFYVRGDMNAKNKAESEDF